MVKRPADNDGGDTAKRPAKSSKTASREHEAAQMKRAQELSEQIVGGGAAQLNKIVDLLELCAVPKATDRARHAILQNAFRAVEYMMRDVVRPGGGSAAEATAYKWARERFEQLFAMLLGLLNHREPGLQVLALSLLIQLIRTETRLHTAAGGTFTFAVDALQRIVTALLRDNERLNEHVLSALCDRYCNEYDDLRFFTYRAIRKVLADGQAALSHVAISNAFELLQRLRMKSREEDLGRFFAEDVPGDEHPVRNLREHRRVFSDCWLQFLRLKLTLAMYKRALVIVYRDVYPHLLQPTLLADFFTDSYNAGGIVSVLALNGIFLLITKHNLDYPQFYPRLYALFTDTLPYVKYRSRFLRLADLFLQSSLLPAYLVAAFVKRMARLTLSAPPSTALVLMTFIYNLLKRHPACMPLLHRMPDDGARSTGGCADPYKPDEPDPAACNALQSSLWELQAMRNHENPTVANFARTFMEPLKKAALDLEKPLESTYESMFEIELKRHRGGAVPVNFGAEPPSLYAKLVHG